MDADEPEALPAQLAAGAARPTHQDIARLAGTSQATVSLVLNNRAGALRISDATRQAVLTAARTLGYAPNLGARRLRHRLRDAATPDLTLAILRPAGSPLNLVVRLLEAATIALATLSLSSQVVIEEYRPGRLAEHAGLATGTRFHGAIVSSPTPADEDYLERATLPVPVVAFQRQLRCQASVDVDNVRGCLEATRHLLARGRSRIVALRSGTLPSTAIEHRLAGYEQALREAGHAPAARVVSAPTFSEAGGAEATARLLTEDRPDALLVLSDVLAVGALHAVKQAGRRVPEDVAIIGYDDLPFAAFLEPPLTTVRLPYDAMGRAAVAWLADAARSRADAPLHAVYQPELVVRAST